MPTTCVLQSQMESIVFNLLAPVLTGYPSSVIFEVSFFRHSPKSVSSKASRLKATSSASCAKNSGAALSVVCRCLHRDISSCVKKEKENKKYLITPFDRIAILMYVSDL
ncbi:hypothetical protein Dsin_015777 [Dipteronia sinensis]|uniref:Uncharacterized protein n=1 Tax=Dipteronia sinensis TaxID=43782 RepID=A0AAE0E4V9_9ROSI|nr:hypothetical protein Dsin_015777 [Dipteronia sinensis]